MVDYFLNDTTGISTSQLNNQINSFASSSNIANYLVRRNATGNFSCSNITTNGISFQNNNGYTDLNINPINISSGFPFTSPTGNFNITQTGYVLNISAAIIYQNDNTYDAFRGFRKDTGAETGWAGGQQSYNPNGLYNASGTFLKTTGDYAGDWIQINISKPFTISGFSIRKVSDSQYPTSFRLFGSNDGLNWTSLYSISGATYPAGNNTEQTFNLTSIATYTWYRLATAAIVQSSPFNQLQFKGLQFNGYLNESSIGIGVSPTNFNLELIRDSAFKPSTNTWTTSSDERLKENIEIANYDTCYDVVKQLDLKYYKWRDDISDLIINDKHKLGWIANDVEPIFPKAVEILPQKYGLENVLTLNTDQIYATMYGTIKKLIMKVEELENKINNL